MKDLQALINEYQENKKLIEQLNDINDGLKAQIIEGMAGKDTLIEGPFKVTYKPFTSNRFNSKKFKVDHNDLYNEYLNQIQAYRFIIK